MLKFPKDSLDNNEVGYWPLFSHLYPAYKEFWEKFVGRRLLEDRGKYHLVGYGLIRKDLTEPPDGEVVAHYQKIGMIHYSIFCDLVYAHFEMEDAAHAAARGSSREHWRYFENFYFRLGSIGDRFTRMWDTIAKLFRNTGVVQKFEHFRRDVGNHPTAILAMQKYDTYMEKTKVIRNNVCHFARLGYGVRKGKFVISNNIRRNPLWPQAFDLDREPLIETTDRMQSDLAHVFGWLQPLETELIRLYEAGMAASNFAIDYENVESSETILRNVSYEIIESVALGYIYSPLTLVDYLSQATLCSMSCETFNESGSGSVRDDISVNPDEQSKKSDDKTPPENP